MAAPTARIGVYGLAVMGQNLALNIAEKGFNVSVGNRSPAKVDLTVERAKKEKLDDKLTGYKSPKAFVDSLRKPRCVFMLVKAGKPVDLTIAKLLELLEEGDILIDGGNEFYMNTERRMELAAQKGVMYMGIGVSGGEEGARNGPSMMPGGPKEAYDIVKDIFEKVAAQTQAGPCVEYLGKGGSGNFVKMVHNGIEYGDMQLIAESYNLMKSCFGMSPEEMSKVFGDWNKRDLESYLIEITSIILTKKDDLLGDGNYVLDKIKDQTGSKGTGKWTVQQAADVGMPAPVISAALEARYISAQKPLRVEAAKHLKGPDALLKDTSNKKDFLADLENALFLAKMTSYAQGLCVIKAKSDEMEWNIDLSVCGRIWMGGCIIRSKFLTRIKDAYTKNPNLQNMLLDSACISDINKHHNTLRKIVGLAVKQGIPVPAFSNALAYIDSFRTARLPACLTQAQRDFFGAHTYERLDKPDGEWFHTTWTDEHKTSATSGSYNN